jgi:hypothetical protein
MLVTKHEYGRLPSASEFVRRAHFFRNLPEYVWLAGIAAVDLADSYRVRVGSVVVADNTEAQAVGVYVAGNDKPTPVVRKRCAEAKGLQEANEDGYRSINGLVVKGPQELDVITSVNPVYAPTLHSCGECLHKFLLYQRAEGFHLSGETPIVTTTGLSGRTQIHSLDEMLTHHGVEIPQPVMPPDHVFENIGGLDWQRAAARYAEISESAAYGLPDERPSEVALMRQSLAVAA